MNITEANAAQTLIRALLLVDDRPTPDDDHVRDAAAYLADRASKTLAAGATGATIRTAAWRTR